MKNKHFKKIIALILILAVGAAVAVTINSQTDGYDDGISIVCLDAGHGGSDSGAVSNDGTRLEKDDNLKLTLAVKERLEAQGITVILTRDDDSEVSLKGRCRLANRKKCDLFVSIHRNSAESDASGIEAWISNTAVTKESKIAKTTVDGICEATGQTNRGVKRGYQSNTLGNYYVNEKTKMPSMLLEVGFISSDSDNDIFDEKLSETADSIANSIIGYFN